MSAVAGEVVLGAGVVVITALKTPDYKFCVVTALQRKSHLSIPFLGIARPQPHFPHSCVC
jgi:hypothetical protein